MADERMEGLLDDEVMKAMTDDEGMGDCVICRSLTTYSGSFNGDYPVWLCPTHGGKPRRAAEVKP